MKRSGDIITAADINAVVDGVTARLQGGRGMVVRRMGNNAIIEKMRGIIPAIGGDGHYPIWMRPDLNKHYLVKTWGSGLSVRVVSNSGATQSAFDVANGQYTGTLPHMIGDNGYISSYRTQSIAADSSYFWVAEFTGGKAYPDNIYCYFVSSGALLCTIPFVWNGTSTPTNFFFNGAEGGKLIFTYPHADATWGAQSYLYTGAQQAISDPSPPPVVGNLSQGYIWFPKTNFPNPDALWLWSSTLVNLLNNAACGGGTGSAHYCVSSSNLVWFDQSSGGSPAFKSYNTTPALVNTVTASAGYGYAGSLGYCPGDAGVAWFQNVLTPTIYQSKNAAGATLATITVPAGYTFYSVDDAYLWVQKGSGITISYIAYYSDGTQGATISPGLTLPTYPLQQWTYNGYWIGYQTNTNDNTIVIAKWDGSLFTKKQI